MHKPMIIQFHLIYSEVQYIDDITKTCIQEKQFQLQCLLQ